MPIGVLSRGSSAGSPAGAVGEGCDGWRGRLPLAFAIRLNEALGAMVRQPEIAVIQLKWKGHTRFSKRLSHMPHGVSTLQGALHRIGKGDRRRSESCHGGKIGIVTLRMRGGGAQPDDERLLGSPQEQDRRPAVAGPLVAAVQHGAGPAIGQGGRTAAMH